jgi:hypothetical protein
LDYHGDSGIVQPRGNVRIQTQTPAQGILSAIAIYRQLRRQPTSLFADNSPTGRKTSCLGIRSAIRGPKSCAGHKGTCIESR